MNNNTVPTHSVVDPRGGSQTPPCWLEWITNHCLYIYIYMYIYIYAKRRMPGE